MSANSKSPKLSQSSPLTSDPTLIAGRPTVPESDWERFVATVGRGNIFLALGAAIFVAIGLCVLIAIFPSGGKPQTIDPAVALANGGHTVHVRAVYPNGDGLEWGDYSVETQAGLAPSKSKGDLASSEVQVVVGSDWIGQIRIHQDGQCEHFWNRFDIENTTDLIGGPYGWDYRRIVMPYPCR
jgi:hypothetical protein